LLFLIYCFQRNDILKKLQEMNVLVIPSGENVVRFLPPFIIEKEQIDDAIIKLQKILTELE
jgi:acetylornithine/N-succinyldiaminopimelate aminotransferase